MNILNLKLPFEVAHKNDSNEIPQNSKENIHDGMILQEVMLSTVVFSGYFSFFVACFIPLRSNLEIGSKFRF